jgi:hypothetical protein
MTGASLLLLAALAAPNPLAPAVLEHLEARGGKLYVYDSRKGEVAELELIKLHPAARTGDGTDYACADMRQAGSGEAIYDVDFYVRDGRVLDTVLHRKNGRDRLRGQEGPTPAGRVTANAVLDAVRSYLEQSEAIGRGEVILRDPRSPGGSVWLHPGELPGKVYRTGDESYYVPAEFHTCAGEPYRVDIYVRRDHDGYRLVEMVIREVGGKDRLR